MESGNERLFRVLGDVGGDLIATAEQKRFPASPWRRILPAAACLLLAVGLYWVTASHVTDGPQAESTAMAPPAASEPVLEMQTPVEEPAPETGEPAAEQSESALSAITAAAREQLVFWDTIYYVEAQYTAGEAEQRLGASLGQVTQADEEALVGAEVYGCTGAETRPDSKEREVPLEIFVANEQGYLYCLTYYDRNEPLVEWEKIRYFEEYDQMEKAVEQLLTLPEAARQLLELPLNTADGAWSGEELLAFFRATVQMETMFGTHTDDLNRYLWSRDGGYAVPVTDIRRQLDKYLGDDVLIAEELPGYDPESQCVSLPALSLCDEAQAGQIAAGLRLADSTLDEEKRELSLTVECGDGKARQYLLQWRENRIIYAAMEVLEPDDGQPFGED